MRLIDKEQTYQTLSEYYHHTGTIQHMALREALGRVPVVDAVPVIRCKDCARSATCFTYRETGNSEGFCAWAERRP